MKPSNEKIAIVGVACLLPGAKTPQEFWQILIKGQQEQEQVTAEDLGAPVSAFFDPTHTQPDTTYVLDGSFIRDFQFDPAGLNLPAAQLSHLDPAYQWALSVARDALRDAKLETGAASLQRTGVIWGSLFYPTRGSSRLFAPLYSDTLNAAIGDLLQDEKFRLPSLPSSENLIDGLSPGYPAALIAAALGLGAGHFTLDAACSASIYATALACEYLRTGRADVMLAGAASAVDPMYPHLGFAHLNAQPENGAPSQPLDAASEGLIPGEGAGMFVLKRHSDALRDGDHIYALISGVGLSNDGSGKHLLAPNSKGQVIALERAYADAGVTPETVDYVECHATGTPLGDRTEIASLAEFFGNHQPHVGSVKANLGHMLTAAGMPSMLKIILALQHNMIPATPGISSPLTPAALIAPQPWPESETGPRRAGINAFGFGGVSAHLILEGNERQTVTQQQVTSKNNPLAIIGMDAHFGPLDNLDAFARALYDGETAFVPLPEQRWNGLQHQPELLRRFGLEDVPQGAYIDSFDLDFMQVGVPPTPDDQPIPQQLLMLKVADRAIADAGLVKGGNVAVLIAVGTELRLHRYRARADLNWQLQQALDEAGLNLTPEQKNALQAITKDALLEPAQINHYTSTIGNVIAGRISHLWDFSGPAMTVAAEENSAIKALEVAQVLLESRQVDAVVVGAVDLAGGLENVLLHNHFSPVHQGKPVAGIDQNADGWLIGEGAGAIVLAPVETAPPERVYAQIDAVTITTAQATGDLPSTPDANTIALAAQNALNTAGITPEQVGYVEFAATGLEDTAEEINALTQLYRASAVQNATAAGCVKGTIGNTFAASGIASLIKAALCVGQRFIPAVPNWTGPKMPESWTDTPFWVATKSRTWFDDQRVAAISNVSLDGTAGHVILSSVAANGRAENAYLAGSAPYLLPIAGNDAAAITAQLDALEHRLETMPLDRLADTLYTEFAAGSHAVYVLALVGKNVAEIRAQIAQARNGVPTAIIQGTDWSTPAGSAFTANPVGPDAGIAFVYPGAFNAYPRLGYDLLHLFPETYAALQAVKADVGEAVAEKLLYPRTLEKPGPKTTRQLKTDLAADSVATITAGLSFALLYSRIMQDVFGVTPDNAFGYSLGEGSMMWGMGVWHDGDAGSRAFRESDLFTSRLVDPMDAVRDAWGIAQDVPSEDVWATHFIAGPVEAVREAVERERGVYLTHINTPREVMIQGDPEACQRVVDSLNYESMRAPFNVVIHNEVMLSEFAEFRRLHSFPVTPVDGVRFYSAADYAPMRQETATIANSIARMTCKTVDFARLIEENYADGARVFLELGPRSTCARWINETLEDRPHVAVSIDNMGVDARTSIIRMLAQLITHRVAVDISALYRPLPVANGKQLIKSVVVGGQDIYAAIANPENQALFADVERAAPAPAVPAASTGLESVTAMPQALSTTHSDFLKVRRDALRQMGDLIQAQLEAARSGGGVMPALAPMPAMPVVEPSAPVAPVLPPPMTPQPAPPPSLAQGITPMYPFEMVNTFAVGRVADCFGERYNIYDNVRAARIPNGDLLLVTRVLDIQGERYQSKPGTSIVTEYDVPEDAWYYRDNAYPVMPYSVYMEIALQPCGFLSAYHGPTLEFPDIDFYFRNLDGNGKLYKDVDMRGRTITDKVTLLRHTVLSGTIIQTFSFALYDGDDLFYEGEATFGYFTLQALDSQAGLDAGKPAPRWIDTINRAEWPAAVTVDPRGDEGEGYLHLGTGQLVFTDEIIVIPGGGTYGEGYAYANTIINPATFYFSAHFFQDPVMPGSIGVETIMQAMQAFVIKTGLADDFNAPRFAQTDGGHEIVWKYRGQILTNSEKSHVEANIKRVEREPGKLTIYADASLWRDTLRIYEIKDIALTVLEA